MGDTERNKVRGIDGEEWGTEVAGAEGRIEGDRDGGTATETNTSGKQRRQSEKHISRVRKRNTEKNEANGHGGLTDG